MDGSNPVTLVRDAGVSRGIAIDSASRRLYWADLGDKICSSDLEGRDIQTIVQLTDGSYPHGITVLGNRIYWSTTGSNKLESSRKDGSEIRVHHTELFAGINHIVAVPGFNLPTGRTNPCEGQIPY